MVYRGWDLPWRILLMEIKRVNRRAFLTSLMAGVLVLIVLHGALVVSAYNLSVKLEDSDFQLRRPIPSDQLPPDESTEAIDSFFSLFFSLVLLTCITWVVPAALGGASYAKRIHLIDSSSLRVSAAIGALVNLVGYLLATFSVIAVILYTRPVIPVSTLARLLEIPPTPDQTLTTKLVLSGVTGFAFGYGLAFLGVVGAINGIIGSAISRKLSGSRRRL